MLCRTFGSGGQLRRTLQFSHFDEHIRHDLCCNATRGRLSSKEERLS